MSSIINGIFDSKIARRGGIVRRSIRSLHQHGCLGRLVALAQERAFPVYGDGDQLIILCTPNGVLKRIA